ncbi:MAG: hypothetical protein MR014_00490 [Oscillospiraceae bacterium]|nr:hypothetical protein [Oscillospiraceae bacterium]
MEKKEFELKKSWHWMLYIYLVLPGVLFFLAFLIGDSVSGRFFTQLFHSYNLYVLCPIPNFSKWIGIAGLLIPAVLVIQSIRRKDWLDLLICLGIEAAAAVYFFLEWNYLLSGLLSW